MTKRPYRGLVLGFYHQRNAGDDRLASSFERWLSDHQLTFLPHTETPPKECIKRSDYVILGGGSILDGNHGAIEAIDNWSNHLRVPVFVVGTSICSDEPAMLATLRRIGNTGNRIWLRDQWSADRLQAPRGVTVAPDLAWLYPSCPAAPLERDLDAIINLRPWPKAKLQTSHWNGLMKSVFKRTAPWPLCFGRDTDVALSSEAADLEASNMGHFDSVLSHRARFITAMRFHALIFAIQSGTPFLSIDNTKKVTALLDEVGMPWARVKPDCEPAEFHAQVNRARQEMSVERLENIASTQSKRAHAIAATFKAEIERTSLTHRRVQRTLSARVRRRAASILLSH